MTVFFLLLLSRKSSEREEERRKEILIRQAFQSLLCHRSGLISALIVDFFSHILESRATLQK